MSSQTCLPRFATRRRPDRPSRGWQLAKIAAMLGTPLMPWQQLVADVGLELLPDGMPAYRQVVVTVPRQNGKTTLMLAWELHRALMWGDDRRQIVVYGATDGVASGKKLLTDQLPILESSKLAAALESVRRAQSQEAFVFGNGSRLEVMGSRESSLHGRTVDLAVADEVWDDEDDRREQAILPAMATRHDGQYIVISTAGILKSVYLRRKVDQGREFAANDVGEGTAYFEWSADEDADPDDPQTWWSCMPALGHTITEAVVRHARDSMEDDEFRRAYLNQWTGAQVRVIPPETWVAVCGDFEASGRVAFAIDCNPERSAGAVAVCDADRTVEVVDYRMGMGWIVGRAVELAEKYDASVVVDPQGPAGALIPELEAAKVKVLAPSAQDVTHAAGVFYDAVMDAQIRVRANEQLNRAVDGARRRTVGDRWAWARRSSNVDISPLVAVTLAFWMHDKLPAAPVPFVLVGS